MPRPNKTKSRIRSGRFKFGSGVAGAAIILGKSADSFYRFFNGGDQKFNVRTTQGATNTDYPVDAGCSLDLQVLERHNVKIQKLDVNDDVEGVYEAPGVRNDVASGRFKFPVRAVTATPVVVGAIDQIFRLLNSGVNSMNVVANGVTRVLKQDCSLDVFVSSSNITVANLAADQDIRGVYDLLNLNGESDIRSGRFKGDADLPIIDCLQAPRTFFVYRIYNSGTATFKAFLGTDDVGDVEPGTSIEIEIPDRGANRTITIKPDDGEFQGSYEFLGASN